MKCLKWVICVIRCCIFVKFLVGVNKNRMEFRLYFFGMMLFLCRKLVRIVVGIFEVVYLLVLVLMSGVVNNNLYGLIKYCDVL